MAKARRPRMRPRSSLTPMAAMPPMVRAKPRNRSRGGRTGEIGGEAVISVIWGLLRRFHRLSVGGGHLEEQLLEVAGRPREADDGHPGAHAVREEAGRRGVVA